MQTIKVIWKSYHEPEAISRGYWDQGIVERLFLQRAPYNWKSQTEFKDIKENEGAVVVINGRMHTKDAEQINADLAKLRWCLLIITGDEEALFPWQDIKHPLLRVWVQLPRMNVHNDVSFKLPNGPRVGTEKILKRIGPHEKTLDFFFAGQINHPRREQCLEAVRAIAPNAESNGQFIATDGFGKEAIDHETYMFMLSNAKIALCPSGIETPDTFRLYEALEAGCLPIVDAFSARHHAPGFWKYLFGDDIPFPIVDYWDKLPALLPELLKDYPHNANKASAWWQNFKRNMHIKLIDDVTEISK